MTDVHSTERSGEGVQAPLREICDYTGHGCDRLGCGPNHCQAEECRDLSCILHDLCEALDDLCQETPLIRREDVRRVISRMADRKSEAAVQKRSQMRGQMEQK